MAIKKLSKSVANKIAAGEVVERPASCVKELVENSIDAGAKSINISITGAGLQEILVEDDGSGMDYDDASLAFERHATSKIFNAEDLFTIKSLGFRGEALPSIASVSQVVMVTRTKDSDVGYQVSIDAGAVEEIKEVSASCGTSISVKNLFFNTPARLKYLSTERTESRKVTQIVSKLALARPDISFSLKVDDRTILMTSGSGDLLDAVAKVIGVEYAKKMIPIDKESEGAHITGYIAPSDMSKSGRDDQYFSVNGRPFVSKEVYSATDRAAEFLVAAGRKLPLVYALEVDPSLVDVNVHPAKTEVRFSEDRKMYSLIYHATQDALQSIKAMGEIEFATKSEIDTPTEEQLYFVGLENRPDAKNYSDIDQLFSDNNDLFANKSEPSVFKESFENRYLADYMQVVPKEMENFASQPGFQVRESNPSYYPSDLKVIGQIGLTYIIVQHPEGMYIIDQHVAHERILVDMLRARERGREIDSQSLLIPEVLELTPSQISIYKEHAQAIADFGFDIGDFGGNTVVLRKVPLVPGSFSDPVPLFLGVLEDLADVMPGMGPENIYDKLIVSMSCKGAVKAGMYLQIDFMQKLVEDLFKTSQPFNCPHGRPIILNLTYDKLNRSFKRI